MTRIQDAYRAGFMAKCAEYGVDGRRLFMKLGQQQTLAQPPPTPSSTLASGATQQAAGAVAPSETAQQPPVYEPPAYVGVDSDGNWVRLPKYDPELRNTRAKEVQKRYGITDWDIYRDDAGVRHSILEEEFGVPKGYRVMPRERALEFTRRRVAERMQPAADMGKRYRLQQALQQMMKDKERMRAASKDFYGQYTPLGGRVTQDSELLRALYDAWAANAGNDEAMRAALTQIGGDFQSYVTPDSPQLRATPITIDLGDLRGSAQRASAGRPNMSLFTDNKNIKHLLGLLKD